MLIKGIRSVLRAFAVSEMDAVGRLAMRPIEGWLGEESGLPTPAMDLGLSES